YGDNEEEQHEIVERLLVMQDVELEEAEIDRLPAPARKPVIAACDIVPAVGDEVEHLAEGDSHHREINAAQPDNQHADNCRRGDPHNEADTHPRKRVSDEVFDGKPGAISAET